jgi:uncharacterized protein (TIGR03437 family)
VHSTRKLIPLLLAAMASTAIAQPQVYALPDATVGVPYSIIGTSQSETFPGLVTFTDVYTASGVLPPGLVFTQEPAITGTPTTAGNYVFTISDTEMVIYDPSVGLPDQSTTISVQVSIKVNPVSGPSFLVSPSGLSFSLSMGTGTQQQFLTIANRSGNAVPFSATVTGGTWLSAAPAGNASAFSQVSFGITVNPAGLVPGTYTGGVTITPSSASGSAAVTIPIVVTVTGTQQILQLSQSGLFFQAAAGGSTPPAQSFVVINAGAGALNWTASVSTQSSNSGWLSVSPSSGQSTSSSSPTVSVKVTPAGLAAGTYYGQVQVSSPSASNSPQLVTIVVNVASSALPTDPDVRPTGLIFVSQNGASPASRSVQLTNLGSTPVTYSTSLSYSQGKGWLSVTPPSGTVAPGTPGTPSVSVSPTGLAPGIYTAQVTISFAETLTSHRIAILLIVVPGSPGSIPSILSSLAGVHAASGCTPAKLLPLFTSLGQNFTTSAAWPSSVEVTVVDDCGNSITSGLVSVSFSTGDDPISLLSLGDGRWSGTWIPQNTRTTAVAITASAQTVTPPLLGSVTIGGVTQANPTVPVVTSGGVVSAASYAGSVPLAPGSMMSIFGAGLAQNLTVSQSLPLATMLGGTQVLLGGKAIPLLFTSSGQINALVPYDVVTNTAQQLLVTSGPAYSVPVQVRFADGAPAVFTSNQNGSGQGIAVGVKPDGTQYLNSPTNPSPAGDALVIYCAGLGSVNQPVTAGSVSPSSPLADTKNAVTVTIEGKAANVFYAGLAPGFAGLYQVNVTVPAGLTPSSNAPLVITVSGQASPVTTVAVR